MQLRALAALAALVAVGCGDDPHWGARAASEARELAILAEVEVVEMTREEFAAQAEERAGEIDEAYLQYMADTYGRLGFFDLELDLRPVFAGSSSDWVGATYSPSSKRITLVGEAADSTVVHEFVHALQDQHFAIADYDRPQTSDSFLARRAVVEGDATLAQYRYLIGQEQEGADLDDIDWRSLLERWREYSVATLADSEYPPVFLDYVSFTYPYGLEYSASNLIGITFETPTEAAPSPHDWGRQDELYVSRPPETTAQILDLDLTPAGDGQQVGLAEVPASLADRLTTVDWDRLGAWYVYLLLFPLDQQAVLDGRQIADGWRGDRVLFVRDVDTDAAGTLWASVWVDEAAATATADALAALYQLEPVQGQPPEVGRAADGELVWLETRGASLVTAKNLAPDVAPALVDAAFEGGTALRRRTHPSLPEAIERLRRRGDVPCAPQGL